MKTPVIRLHITRSVGSTSVSLECPADLRVETVAHAKEILAAMPESTFTGDGVAITSIPMHGPDMDGPMGFRRISPND